MGEKNEKYIVRGPSPPEPMLNISLGKFIYDKLRLNINSEEEAMVDGVTGEKLSYKQVLEKSCTLASTLLKNGYGKNSIFAICSENNLDFHVAIISALFIGAITAPINPNYIHQELEHCLNISKPKIIFCSKNAYQKILEMKKKLGFIEKIIVIGNKSSNYTSLEKFTFGNFIDKFQPIDVDPKEQLALIMCSSGTTGLPKGVMITNLNITTMYIITRDPNSNERGTDVLAFLPFFHIYSLLVVLFGLIGNQKIIVMKRFEENLFLSLIEKYKIRKLSLVPPLMIFLAKSPLITKYDLSSVEDISCGAGPLDKAIERIVKEKLKIKVIRQGYGLTESTLAVMYISDNEKLGSCGKLVSHISCKVRDPKTGKSLGPNQVGELCFKGPLVVKGYYKNDEATKNLFTEDGWLLTGDLGYYDEDEYFFIVDRIKELIKYKGYQVAPAELEAILLNHSEIIDAGVVGLPDETAGELPVAFVVKAPNSKINETDVKKFVAERVSSQKRLRGGVHFVDQIPKNPSGKILRRELRTLLKKIPSKL